MHGISNKTDIANNIQNNPVLPPKILVTAPLPACSCAVAGQVIKELICPSCQNNKVVQFIAHVLKMLNREGLPFHRLFLHLHPLHHRTALKNCRSPDLYVTFSPGIRFLYIGLETMAVDRPEFSLPDEEWRRVSPGSDAGKITEEEDSMAHKKSRYSWLRLGVVIFSLIVCFSFACHGATTLTSFETANFSGSGICAVCHSSLRDSDGTDVSIDAQWRSTMMANAAKDPFWQAKISAEVALVPSMSPDGLDLPQVIQEKCSRCHMGMARYQALTDGTPTEGIYVLKAFGGFLDPNHLLHEAAMDGVSCTLCHQIQPGNLGTPDSYTGNYTIDTTTASPGRTLFGPFTNPLINPMQRNSGFRPTPHNPEKQLTDSALCGSCHTLFTPTLAADGTYIGEFPEQTTYLEWEYSQFDRTCQHCHVPQASSPVVISNRPRRLAERSPFGEHHYVGGNSFMVNLLMNNATELGVTADTKHLDATILRTLLQLHETRTAMIEAEAVLSAASGLLTVTVDVTNLAGHKFPSGLPSRRAWLHVKAVDGSRIIFESGAPLAGGSIAGNDADEDPRAYEPHYDTIKSADQVQIYEPVMLNDQGEVTYTLMRANEYAKDNRLLPANFDKNKAPDEIAVYGEARSDDDFIGGSDRVVYEVPEVFDFPPGSLTVTVELLFQTLSYPFVRDLEMTATPEVVDFMARYNKETNVPVVVDSTVIIF